jgi:hypothetical protein
MRRPVMFALIALVAVLTAPGQAFAPDGAAVLQDPAIPRSPAASFEQLTIGATAGSLAEATIRPTALQGRNVQFCWGMLETANVRFRYDGGVPTASVGHLAEFGRIFTIVGQDNITKLQFIRTSGTSGTLPLTCHQ